MSTYEEVVETKGKYRVKLVADEDAQEPYNDGGSPLLRYVSGTYSTDVEQITGITSYVVPTEILRAGQQLERDIFERYLRIFHGATTVHWWHSGNYLYVTFDTAHWREAMGMTAEHLAAHPNIVLADMDEWKAYCNGEVYGVIVEHREPGRADRAALDAVRAEADETATYDQVVSIADMLANDDDDLFQWTEVDAVWGFYGDTYATEAARERLAEYDTPGA